MVKILLACLVSPQKQKEQKIKERERRYFFQATHNRKMLRERVERNVRKNNLFIALDFRHKKIVSLFQDSGHRRRMHFQLNLQWNLLFPS